MILLEAMKLQECGYSWDEVVSRLNFKRIEKSVRCLERVAPESTEMEPTITDATIRERFPIYKEYIV